MASVEELIDDLRAFGPTVLRSSYRRLTKFPTHAYEKYFKTFAEFRQAAFSNKENVQYTQGSLSETNELVNGTWNISLPKTSIHTLQELLDYCEVDLSVWQVERFVANKYEQASKNAAGDVQTTPLFQVKATLVRREEIVSAKEEIEKLKEQAKVAARIPKTVIRSNKKSGNMLEIALNDAHFGKLAWGRETGGPNYDTRIAQAVYLEAVEHILDRTAGFKFDEILFVVGNDLLHSDDLQGRTTKGTVVSCDIRYYKTFEVVRETITQSIERLRQIAPVTVKMVQGNHDELSVWHLGDSLSALFSKYNDVTIDNEPTLRKYHQWGVNGLMFTHGDKGKRADYPLLFATERSDIFGATKFREVHTGHYHQTKTEEFHGVRVRIIPSLSPADSWHAANGFVGQQRVGEAYVFNKDAGLVAQFYYNADS